MLNVGTFSANSYTQISESSARILCIVFCVQLKLVEYKTQD